MTEKNPLTLSARIAKALTDETSTSTSISAVIADAEAEAAEMDRAKSAAEAAALDPLSDAATAAKWRNSAEAVGFEYQRLSVAVERLSVRLAAALAREQATRDAADYEAAKKERDAIAVELANFYPEAAKKIAELFRRVQASNDQIAIVNATRAGEHLLPAEHVARGGVPVNVGSLLETVRLPNMVTQGLESLRPYWGL